MRTNITRSVARLTKFRDIPPLHGATLAFGDIEPLGSGSSSESANQLPGTETIHHVGTYGLYTCVGAYFAICERRCFAAHINSVISRWTSSSFIVGGGPTITRKLLEPEDFGYFRRVVRERLEMHARAHD